MQQRRRWLSGLVASLLALTLAAPALAAGQGSSKSLAQVTGNVAPWVKSAQYVGPVDPNQTTQITVWLKFRNEKTLEGYLRTAQTKGGGKSNHLTLDQFMEQYGPSAADYQAVQDWLTGQGLSIAGLADNRLFVKAEGTVAQVQQALGVQINTYSYGGSVFQSNSSDPKVPGNLTVDAVTGMDTAANWQPRAHLAAEPRTTANAVPCGDAGLSENCYYLPDQVRKAYGLNQTGLDGTGSTIVIIDAYGSATAAQELSQFNQDFGLPPADLTILGNNGTPNMPPTNPHYENQQGWAGEIALDLQWAHAMAPGAKLVLLASGNNQRDLDEAVNWAVVHDLGDVISLSWGLPEIYMTAAHARSIERIFQEAAAQGVSVQNSSGDSGDNSQRLGLISADYPSTSPYITSVGGTSLFLNPDNSFAFETAWGTTIKKRPQGSDLWQDLGFQGGGGGGVSRIFAKPDWQPGLSGTMRAVPDISMVGDPYTGVPVNIGGTYYIYGGTSLSCPLFSGLVAQAVQAKGARVGLVAPQLYAAGAGAIRDVAPRDLSGLTTHFTGSVSGASYEVGFGHDTSLTVTGGWDNATGLGSPWAPALVQTLSQ